MLRPFGVFAIVRILSHISKSLLQVPEVSEEFVLSVEQLNLDSCLSLGPLGTADVSSVSALHQSHNVWKLLFSLFFEIEQRGWVSNEDLGLSHSVLLRVDLVVVQQSLSTALGVSLPLGPGFLAEHLVSPHESLIGGSERKTSTPDSDVFDQTKVSNLVSDSLLIKNSRLLVVVWFDTPDVVWFTRQKFFHQSLQSILELNSSCDGSFLRIEVRRREQSEDQGVVACQHCVNKVNVESVFVLIEEAIHTVGNISCIVLQPEGSVWNLSVLSRLVRFKVSVLSKVVDASVQEGCISRIGQQAALVQQTDDTHFSFNKFTNDLVVEVVNLLPFDSFSFVFFLFALQGELNEQLLKLFVTQVDGELLKAVVIKDFETVNVENTHNQLLSWSLAGQSVVDLLDNPVEKSLVHGFSKSVSGEHGLLRIQWNINHTHSLSNTSGNGSSNQSSSEDLWVTAKLGSSHLKYIFIVHFDFAKTSSFRDGNVTQVQDSSEQLQHVRLVFLGESKSIKSFQNNLEVCLVVDGINLDTITVAEVVVLAWVVLKLHVGKLLWSASRKHLIEDVEGSLSLSSINHSGLFQQIVCDFASNRRTIFLKLNLHVLSESTGVVISYGFGISKGFKDRIRIDELTLHSINVLATFGHSSNVLHENFGGFCLSSTGFTTDNNTLIFLMLQ
mmetsp:Transcript_27233/g.38372  ORF Transcript_27233/g.38372 Transcript_27233/m.38372 type:complete len:670 (+) Transcript_27233:792-2801(+)